MKKDFTEDKTAQFGAGMTTVGAMGKLLQLQKEYE